MAVLCRDGWTRIPGSGTCIKLFDKLRTWAEARAECKAKAGDLVKIVDEGMDDIIMGMDNNSSSVIKILRKHRLFRISC